MTLSWQRNDLMLTEMTLCNGSRHVTLVTNLAGDKSWLRMMTGQDGNDDKLSLSVVICNTDNELCLCFFLLISFHESSPRDDPVLTEKWPYVDRDDPMLTEMTLCWQRDDLKLTEKWRYVDREMTLCWQRDDPYGKKTNNNIQNIQQIGQNKPYKTLPILLDHMSYYLSYWITWLYSTTYQTGSREFTQLPILPDYKTQE
jgi:hypothetical protein